MEKYLVGGAVRDRLLGLSINERDWVVVGATVDEMLRLGYKPVGKDFPVFLHPETKEEYALARTERKVGRGYTGFAFNAAPDVTLEEDLKRRDLTINAMAETEQGDLIDPYAGKQDLKEKWLRHVSPAFIEDPVRILRVARFAARFSQYGFRVAPETIVLMQQMVKLGEVNDLVAERVWKELERALAEKNPEQFFEVLDQCGALGILFPDIKLASRGVEALKKSKDTLLRFAVLLHHLSLAAIKNLIKRYRIPKNYSELALLVAEHLDEYQKADQLSAEKILNLLQSTDAFRRQERFEKFLLACELISPKNNSHLLMICLESAKKINIQDLIEKGFKASELGDEINKARLSAIKTII